MVENKPESLWQLKSKARELSVLSVEKIKK
jgi:hypothetical protein